MQKVAKALLIARFGSMAKAARHFGTHGPSPYYWIKAGFYLSDCGRIVAIHAEPVAAPAGLKKGDRVSYPSGRGVLMLPDQDDQGVVIVRDESGGYRRVAHCALVRE